MTTNRSDLPGCPDAETMAEFIDGRLNGEARARVERHLVSCQDCYGLFVGAALASQTAERPVTTHPVAVRRPWARYVMVATGLAAAAVVAIVAGRQWQSRASASPIAELVRVAANSRPTEARLSGGFQWAPLDSAVRGSETTTSAAVKLAVAQLEVAVTQDRSAGNLAAVGAARLFTGQTSSAVTALQEATTLDDRQAEYWSDLSAAYLARATEPGADVDLPRALDAADKAVSLNSGLAEGWFNKAVALERLHMTSGAREAWTRYLSLDARSGWHDEAQRRLEKLTVPAAGPPSGRAPDVEQLRHDFLADLLPEWGDAVQANKGSAAALAAIRAAVSEIDRLDGTDQMASDALRAIERAQASGPTLQSAAAGHSALGRGQVAMHTEGYDVAGAEFARARESFERVGSPISLLARFDETNVVIRRQKYDEARRLLDVLRPDVERRRYVSLLGSIDLSLALLDSNAGRPVDALARSESALSLFEAAKEPANSAAVRTLLAYGYDGIGDPLKGWALRVQGLRGDRRPGVFLSAGIAAARRGWRRTALDFAREGFEIAREQENPGNMADALRTQAQLHAQLGNVAPVAGLVAAARAQVAGRQEPAWDRVRAEIDVAEAQAADAAHSPQGIEPADRAIAYFTGIKATVRLPELFLARARLERRAGRTSDASRDTSQGLAILEAERRKLPSGTYQATFETIERDLVNEVVASANIDADADAAFNAVDSRRGRDTTNQPGSASLSQLIAFMPRGTTLAEYVVGEDASYLWVVTSSGRTFRHLPAGRQQLAALVAAVSPPRSEGSAAAALARLILHPALDGSAPGDELVIVPDGPLRALPFALLPDQTGAPAIRTRAIVVAPSSDSWMRATTRLARIGTTPREVWAVGDPALDRAQYPDLHSLPEADAEARQVASRYSVGTSLIGPAATRQAIVQALKTADILHFAGHAVLTPWAADASYLALSGPEPSRLTAANIRAFAPLPSRLVVLSSCASAADGRELDAGPLSLIRAFFAAGVPAVVGNLWPVSDRTSREFFDRFHAVFQKTGDAPGALRQAQMSLATSPDRTLASPAQWGGFVVMGGSTRSTLHAGDTRDE